MPGRHHAITKFQVDHLRGLLAENGGAEVIWAVTSADHGGTQRNPITGARRLGMIEHVVAIENLPSEVFLIPNRGYKTNFAHYLVEQIRTNTDGRVELTPNNTLVVCSTEEVAAQYKELGFSIDSAESGTPQALPWDVVEAVAVSGSDWQDSTLVREYMQPESARYYERYNIAAYLKYIFTDPLIAGGDGDITTTRDYTTYRQAFEDNAWRKVDDIAPYVRPGKIVDIGCATGQTLKLLSERPELFESDFYGVEVTRALYEICQQRKTNGEFGDENMFFYQRNIMQAELFRSGSMDTVITMALTHEIESYMGRAELKRFLKRTYEMTAPGGVYINYDVVGPDEPDKLVYVQFTSDDGDNPADLGWQLEGVELAGFLRGLSTLARFKRFTKDFRQSEGDGISIELVQVDGDDYYRMRHADLCDFLAKKDYVNSWKSEMHERFCFFSHEEWCREVGEAGFIIADGTRAIRNTWLIDNRFAPAAKVYAMVNDKLEPVEQPITNTLLVCKRPD